MKLSDFDYHLPEELIAQTPIEPRDHSRLLQLNKTNWEIKEWQFFNILDELWENDVLVLNKTKVINARLHGYITNIEWNEKEVEIFLHKQLDDTTWDCLVFPGKKLKPGKKINFYLPSPLKGEGLEVRSDDGLLKSGPVIMTAEIKDISDSGRIVEFSKWGLEFMEIIEKLWEIPLPPYIKEKLENSSRYQTVFNEVSGSVAAPTAGLHFTPELIEKLKNKWVTFEKVLLHVGLGTFKNVEVDDVTTHNMHKEYIQLEEDVAQRLNEYKQAWKRVIAVWTTSIRVLESFSDETGLIKAGSMDTDIFIYPGYNWKFVDGIITNFHLPKSTLVMLVSSFAGKQNIENAYKYAVDNKFRFFSFWDAMFIK